MSDDDKFHVIGEVKVGTLDENMRLEWDRLYAEQLKLVRLQQAHEEALDAFWDALQRQFGHHAELHDVTQNFRVSEEGDVYLEHCRCPICQATIHGMTVLETVEQMYKSDLIPHHTIDFVRQRARAVDSAKKISKKMLN
jgi:RNAse (barnase) inhibitor barstar